MPQDDPQNDDAPEDMHRVVIAAFASSPAERVEQLGIGQGREQILDGLQGGAVFRAIPNRRAAWPGGGSSWEETWDFREEKSEEDVHTIYYAINPRGVGAMVEKSSENRPCDAKCGKSGENLGGSARGGSA